MRLPSAVPSSQPIVPGQLTLPVPVPQIGVLSTVLHAQMAVATASECYLGAPTTITILDIRY